MTEYVDAMRDIAVLALEDIKAKEIQVLDTTTLTDLFDWNIIVCQFKCSTFRFVRS